MTSCTQKRTQCKLWVWERKNFRDPEVERLATGSLCISPGSTAELHIPGNLFQNFPELSRTFQICRDKSSVPGAAAGSGRKKKTKKKLSDSLPRGGASEGHAHRVTMGTADKRLSPPSRFPSRSKCCFPILCPRGRTASPLASAAGPCFPQPISVLCTCTAASRDWLPGRDHARPAWSAPRRGRANERTRPPPLANRRGARLRAGQWARRGGGPSTPLFLPRLNVLKSQKPPAARLPGAPGVSLLGARPSDP